MLKTLGMILAGFVFGLILSENAQVIRHAIPRDNQAGSIYQFIFIVGIGNSGNTFEVNAGDETLLEETDE